MFDQYLRGLFRVRDDVLDRSAESSLDGDLIFLRNINEVRHNAVDAFYPVTDLHDTLDAVSVAVIALRQVP